MIEQIVIDGHWGRNHAPPCGISQPWFFTYEYFVSKEKIRSELNNFLTKCIYDVQKRCMIIWFV